MISAEESVLVGGWVFKGNEMEENEVARRITELVENHLMKIKSDQTGWCTLYLDPNDNRYWELVYADSQLHGGGPRSLIHLTEAEAVSKYTLSDGKRNDEIY